MITSITVDRIMRDAITKAAEYYGGQSALERACGVSQKNITRYISGKGYRMGIENWRKLYAYCQRFLPAEKMTLYDPQRLEQFPQQPATVQDFNTQTSELALVDSPRFTPVPVISIAQAAEYEPIEPLVDYLREVSERTQVFVDVKDNYFAVEITGNSMSPDYPDGSIALVAAGEFPERGDIVVAKFSSGEVVIKEYQRKDGVISLLSRNPHGQNYEWNIKEQPGFVQWIFPVIEIVLKPRSQRHCKIRN